MEDGGEELVFILTAHVVQRRPTFDQNVNGEVLQPFTCPEMGVNTRQLLEFPFSMSIVPHLKLEVAHDLVPLLMAEVVHASVPYLRRTCSCSITEPECSTVL